jgi:hypothetical protein
MACHQVVDGDGLQIWRVATNVFVLIPCLVGPCHHNMVHPLAVDGGDNLQIWKVTVNILNRQLWIADKGWCSILWVGQRANNSLP